MRRPLSAAHPRSRSLALAYSALSRLFLSLSQLVLDKENFTLEELLEEDDVIQECKSLNIRLIN